MREESRRTADTVRKSGRPDQRPRAHPGRSDSWGFLRGVGPMKQGRYLAARHRGRCVVELNSGLDEDTHPNQDHSHGQDDVKDEALRVRPG